VGVTIFLASSGSLFLLVRGILLFTRFDSSPVTERQGRLIIIVASVALAVLGVATYLRGSHRGGMFIAAPGVACIPFSTDCSFPRSAASSFVFQTTTKLDGGSKGLKAITRPLGPRLNRPRDGPYAVPCLAERHLEVLDAGNKPNGESGNREVVARAHIASPALFRLGEDTCSRTGLALGFILDMVAVLGFVWTVLLITVKAARGGRRNVRHG
jgi:hypothetical protein